MLLVGRGAMKLKPHLAYGSLDAENAYGAMRRSCVLCGTLQYMPKHSGILRAQWSGTTRAWIEEEPGVWNDVHVVEGAAQGETGSTPAFTRGLRVVLEDAAVELESAGIQAHWPSLVDDMLLICEPARFDEAVVGLQQMPRNKEGQGVL